MKYDIYFHNDFDGRASAAMILHFLRSRGDDIEHFTPVNYDVLPRWLDERFFQDHKFFSGTRNPVIIVDFLYHPEASMWFDHHPTTFKKDIWRKQFRTSKGRHFQPEYLSCSHQVYDGLRKDFGWRPPRHLTDLAKQLDMIDGARFKSAKQTIAMKELAIQIEAYIDKAEHDPRNAKWLVELLSDQPLSAIVKIPKVKKMVATIRKEMVKGLGFYRTNLRVFGNTTVIDLTSQPYKSLRYAAYYLYPKVRYGVRLSKKENLYHLSAGANPWLKTKNKIHLGELLKNYGGGGHKDAGGLELRTAAETNRTIKEIVARLNR